MALNKVIGKPLEAKNHALGGLEQALAVSARSAQAEARKQGRSSFGTSWRSWGIKHCAVTPRFF